MNHPKNKSTADTIKSQRRYSAAKAGALLVWEDPADGKTYVVNGHDRHDLAMRTGQPHELVMKINAPTAEDAKVVGAETNIREGHGSAVDAARYFKSAKILTPQDVVKRALPLGQPNVADGLAMAGLRGDILDQVERGEIPEQRAVAIGRARGNAAQQEAALRAIARMERRGTKVTHGQAESIARQVADADVNVEPGQDLFSFFQRERPLHGEQSEIDDYVLQKMRRGKNAGRGSDTGSGPGMEPESQTQGRTMMPGKLYTSLINRPGRLNDIRATAAMRLAKRQGPPLKIKGEAYFHIKRELEKQLGTGRGTSLRPQK
jgi:hypothetical protein